MNRPLSQQAHFLTTNKNYQRFAFVTNHDTMSEADEELKKPVLTSQSYADLFLKHKCDIKSKTELDRCEQARQRFRAHHGEYSEYCRQMGVIDE